MVRRLKRLFLESTQEDQTREDRSTRFSQRSAGTNRTTAKLDGQKRIVVKPIRPESETTDEANGAVGFSIVRVERRPALANHCRYCRVT